jgi:hypothetical protein
LLAAGCWLAGVHWRPLLARREDGCAGLHFFSATTTVQLEQYTIALCEVINNEEDDVVRPILLTDQ